APRSPTCLPHRTTGPRLINSPAPPSFGLVSPPGRAVPRGGGGAVGRHPPPHLRRGPDEPHGSPTRSAAPPRSASPGLAPRRCPCVSTGPVRPFKGTPSFPFLDASAGRG